MTKRIWAIAAAGVAGALLWWTQGSPPEPTTAPIATAPAPARPSVQAERIAYLRTIFPNNRLIPTDDPVERAVRASRARAQREREQRMAKRTASDEDIRAYFDEQRADIAARIELASYVLTEPQWEPEIYAKYQRVLEQADVQLARIDALEQQSLALAHLPRSAP